MEQRLHKNNKTRINFIGLAFIIIMAGLISLSFSENLSAGCEGDCMSCHPKLIDSPEHSSLKTCVSCHNLENKKPKMVIASLVDSGCGSRCFECHQEWPKDGHHVSLNTCLTCHTK